MKEFLKLNKHKILFAFKYTSILCLSVCILFLTIAKLNQNQFPNTLLLIVILINGGIIFPFLIIFISYLNWENEKRYYSKFIKTKIEESESNYGYSEKLKNQNSKWFFTKKILSKNIKGFEIEIKFEYENIEFYVCAKNKGFEKIKLKSFEKKIEELNIENFIFRVFYLRIKRKKFKDISMNDIEIKIAKFINLLEEYNYQPEK